MNGQSVSTIKDRWKLIRGIAIPTEGGEGNDGGISRLGHVPDAADRRVGDRWNDFGFVPYSGQAGNVVCIFTNTPNVS